MTPIQPVVKKGGGGVLGAIGSGLGALGGLLAAPFTGGTSLLGTIGSVAGAAGGATALAGQFIDPKKEDKASPTIGGAMQRRAATVTSSEPNRILEESLAAIQSPGVPDAMRSEYGPALTRAYSMINRRGAPGAAGVIS